MYKRRHYYNEKKNIEIKRFIIITISLAVVLIVTIAVLTPLYDIITLYNIIICHDANVAM
jgi:type IV secretory pathway component VirB8